MVERLEEVDRVERPGPHPRSSHRPRSGNHSGSDSGGVWLGPWLDFLGYLGRLGSLGWLVAWAAAGSFWLGPTGELAELPGLLGLAGLAGCMAGGRSRNSPGRFWATLEGSGSFREHLGVSGSIREALAQKISPMSKCVD